MDPVKILIVEDELIIAESIADMVEEEGYAVTDICMRAEEALDAMKKDRADIAILDIQIKGENDGIWLAEQLRHQFEIPFIFLTSHSDKRTVSQAAATLPYGYILKPIEKNSIYAAIEIALARFSNELHSRGEDVSSFSKSVIRIKDAILVKDEYLFVKIPFTELEFLKADANYVEIFSKGRRRVVKNSLKHIQENLPSDRFFQPHRSYFINIDKIDKLGSSQIQIGDHSIPLVKDRREDLIAQMQRI